MRPGKLFKLKQPTKFYKMHFSEEPPDRLEIGTIFMVLSVKLDQNFGSLSQFYDIHIPWQVLVGKKMGLIEINNVRMEDITPFTKYKEFF